MSGTEKIVACPSKGPFTPSVRCCDGAGDTSLIENNGVTPEWGYNTFWSDSIVFNERSLASIITELRLY